MFSTLVFALNLHVNPPPRIKFVYLPPLDNFLRLGKWFLTVFSAIQNVFFDDFLYPDIFSIFHFKCILIYKFPKISNISKTAASWSFLLMSLEKNLHMNPATSFSSTEF